MYYLKSKNEEPGIRQAIWVLTTEGERCGYYKGQWKMEPVGANEQDIEFKEWREWDQGGE